MEITNHEESTVSVHFKKRVQKEVLFTLSFLPGSLLSLGDEIFLCSISPQPSYTVFVQFNFET